MVPHSYLVTLNNFIHYTQRNYRYSWSLKIIIRGMKVTILLSIAVCKHPLKSTEVKLAKVTSASIYYGNDIKDCPQDKK